MRAEISYDLVMGDEMEFVEGTYRLPDCDWQVFIFSRSDVAQPRVEPSKWPSGVTGVCVRFPRSMRLNRTTVANVLSVALGVSEWVVLPGPDSL